MAHTARRAPRSAQRSQGDRAAARGTPGSNPYARHLPELREEESRVGRIVAVANQKGGVAKTTSVVSLGAAFADAGLTTLLVDLDAQACLTFSLGVDPEDIELSVSDVLLDGVAADAVTLHLDGVDLIPATIDLSGAEAMLLPADERERVLRTALEPVRDRYDVVLLDCTPSLGLLTINALTAADEVLVPVQCEMLSHRGVGQLLDTVADVRRLLNPDLTVRGLLPTMFDARTAHWRGVLADVGERYDLPVLTPIPRSVRFAEAAGMGTSILATARRSAGAQAYRQAARELMAAWRPVHKSTSKRGEKRRKTAVAAKP
jgi:chromosome partitioning protein